MSDINRPITEVAAGILLDAEGRYLLGQRPEGKPYAGYWEVPGGKIEAGESVFAALKREMQEELGIDIGEAQPWKIEMVDYPHALVRLHFCKVFQWAGALQMREAQSFSWESLPVKVGPVLPGTIPVLDWFAAERHFTGATYLIAGDA